MDEFRTGTAQSSPRCDDIVAASSASFEQWDSGLGAPVILVVEDDWPLRQWLLDELATAGWATQEAESGETALKILQSGATIDLLVTDIRLEGKLDGWELVDVFRENNADIPVIYVSGNPSLESRRVANSVFLTKPCVSSKLLAACRALCPID